MSKSALIIHPHAKPRHNSPTARTHLDTSRAHAPVTEPSLRRHLECLRHNPTGHRLQVKRHRPHRPPHHIGGAHHNRRRISLRPRRRHRPIRRIEHNCLRIGILNGNLNASLESSASRRNHRPRRHWQRWPQRRPIEAVIHRRLLRHLRRLLRSLYRHLHRLLRRLHRRHRRNILRPHRASTRHRHYHYQSPNHSAHTPRLPIAYLHEHLSAQIHLHRRTDFSPAPITSPHPTAATPPPAASPPRGSLRRTPSP